MSNIERAKQYAKEVRPKTENAKGIISKRLDRIEHALFIIATWVETGEWNGCSEYIKAILEGIEKNG